MIKIERFIQIPNLKTIFKNKNMLQTTSIGLKP